MNEKIAQLKKEVAELLEWKRQHELRQVDFPLGVSSQNIIRKQFLMFTEEVGAPISANRWLEVERVGKFPELFWLAVEEI